ncbi:MAG: mechanosensitive ion channel [Bacteroidales bacterium]|nr:mechanosensitive ion channel [Bacteroidales bacterium]
MEVLRNPADWLMDALEIMGMSSRIATFLAAAILVTVVIILSYSVNQLAKLFIRKVVHRVIARTQSTWDDIFVENRVFTRLSHLAPAFVIWAMAEWALSHYPWWLDAVQKISYIYVLSVCGIVINAVIESFHQLYLRRPGSERRHIKGYIQLAKILVVIIIILLVISVVFKKDVSSLVLGLGGMAAVLILVFQDTILGFVASMQLSGNRMVSVGDWITIPSRGVDGDVIDMTLYTVKVQNFDKTIVTVPTHALIKESFQNWSGMAESGGRRIKRAIRIDMKSIRFLDEELKKRLYRIQILRPYMDSKEAEIKKYNEENGIDDSCLVNGRRMTNIGTFRAYTQAYLSSHPRVNTDMTFMVRHLAPDEKGLPLEIYVFSKSKEWVLYEAVQADIFDHLLAVVKEFDLRIFEYPTGEDMKYITHE